jgi:hypothetical protein
MFCFYESAKLVIFANSYYVAVDNFCYKAFINMTERKVKISLLMGLP